MRMLDQCETGQPPPSGRFSQDIRPVPPAPNGSKIGAIQLNDVYVDEKQIVYTVDRFSGGLYILECEF